MTARTRSRQARHDPPTAQPDTTELELQELAVLWPRLDAALARDGAGPSAEPSGGGAGSRAESPIVLDLDTERVRTLITVGVHQLEAEAVALLQITSAAERIRQLQRAIDTETVAAQCAERWIADLRVRTRGRRLTVDEHVTASEMLDRLVRAREELFVLRERQARVRSGATTEGVIERLPLWYSQLRDRRQPLADHIAEDCRRWVRDARSVLRLSTGGRRIGWLCPHHRDLHPTELRRESDQAKLCASILAGRPQAHGEAPLRWKHAEAVHCPHCGERWEGLQPLGVLMRMIEQADADTSGVGVQVGATQKVTRRVLLLNGPDLARELGRAPQTLRAWAHAGFITRHGVDDMGRTLYDVDEVLGVSERAQRRSRGIINTRRPTTRMPGA